MLKVTTLMASLAFLVSGCQTVQDSSTHSSTSTSAADSASPVASPDRSEEKGETAPSLFTGSWSRLSGDGSKVIIDGQGLITLQEIFAIRKENLSVSFKGKGEMQSGEMVASLTIDEGSIRTVQEYLDRIVANARKPDSFVSPEAMESMGREAIEALRKTRIIRFSLDSTSGELIQNEAGDPATSIRYRKAS